jgi:hypothetical protein
VSGSENAPGLPDLLSLIPEGHAKAVLRFGFNDLGLSSEEIQAVLYDAHALSRAVGLLLSGRVLSDEPEPTGDEAR